MVVTALVSELFFIVWLYWLKLFAINLNGTFINADIKPIYAIYL